MSVIFKNEQAAKYRDLADKIKASTKVEAGVITEVEQHATYNNNLPEGITPETINTISEYNQRFTKAAHVAVMETAADVFQSDETINKVTGKIGYFAKNDSLVFGVERSREYANNMAKEGQPTKVTKYLVTDCDEQSRGHGLKALKDAISSEFRDSFAK